MKGDINKMENRPAAKDFFLGFLAGGVIAGVTALIFAPKSGKELRREIDKKRKMIANEAVEYWDTAKNRAAGIMTDGRKKADEILKDARNKAASIVVQGKDLVTDEAAKIKEAVKAGVDSYREERK